MSVTATFYNTTSDPRVIGKKLTTTVSDVDCKIYNNSSLIAPTIICKYNASIFGGSNYCYLGAPFNRYYFMSPPQTMDGGRMIIPLNVDVRETYKSGIGGITALVTRSESYNNGMIPDENISATSNYKNTYIRGDKNIFITGNDWHIVLEVIGP